MPFRAGRDRYSPGREAEIKGLKHAAKIGGSQEITNGLMKSVPGLHPVIEQPDRQKKGNEEKKSLDCREWLEIAWPTASGRQQYACLVPFLIASPFQ